MNGKSDVISMEIMERKKWQSDDKSLVIAVHIYGGHKLNAVVF